MIDKIKRNPRIFFFLGLTLSIWVKSMFAYATDFQLGIDSVFQVFLLLLNPFASTMFLLSLGLYIKRTKLSVLVMMAIYTALLLLTYSNVLYYREFSDFLTVNSILGFGSVFNGLGDSSLKLMDIGDIFYALDLPLFVLLYIKAARPDKQVMKKKFAFAVTVFSILLFFINLSLAQIDRPQLLTRTFSRNYLVKYLGLASYTVYDGAVTYQANQIQAQADENDWSYVHEKLDERRIAPSEEHFGLAKDKNVIYIHLESIQQFLIDYELIDADGEAHEVLPFLNALFHHEDTISFENFFHQVAGGKTSDAEMLLDTSMFGLHQGSFFSQLGGTNTLAAAPHLVQHHLGYTTASFHGNAGNFWNRNEVYRRMGYEYFFDASYYDLTRENSYQYGLHDEAFFQQSVQYLERLQQPFYTKFITVTHHFPYNQLPEEEMDRFPQAETSDNTINGYFETANYADRSIEKFFDYLKEAGLYENTMFVLYGDHYGISNSRNPVLGELLEINDGDWDALDNMNLQRVPFMIHLPGSGKGEILPTYGAQIDILPTVLNLLGVPIEELPFIGHDLFSEDHPNIVTFRNGNFITPTYAGTSGTVFDTATGEVIEEPTEEMDETREWANTALTLSDAIHHGDLLRFAAIPELETLDPSSINYNNAMEKMQQIEEYLGDESTSLFSLNQNQTTVDMFGKE